MADSIVRLDMKKIIALGLTLLMIFALMPVADAQIEERADLEVSFKPAENQNGDVVLEIDITVKNGGDGQAIGTLEFRYENELIAAVDRVNARSNSFVRSNPLGLSLTAMTSDLEVEVSYVDFNGDSVSQNMTVSYENAEPQLSFKRTASATAAAQGDKIKLTYIVKNEGGVTLTDLEVYDEMEGLGRIGTVDMLYPGEMREFTTEVKMTKDVKSQPRVSYRTANNAQSMVFVLESMDLVIYNPKLNVTLKSDVSAIQAGDSVTLVCNVVNEGNVSFTNVTISDATLGDLIESARIEVGKAYSWNKLIRPVASQNYMVTVKATDESGQSYTATSNIVAVEVSAASQEGNADVLEVTVTPNTRELEQPGEIIFNVLLRNTGTQDLTGLTITDKNGSVLERVNSLPPGDRVFPIAVSVTETGSYSFIIDGITASGDKVQCVTEPVEVTVGLVQKNELTPTGESAPTATPLAITEGSGGGISPGVLMLLIVIALLIIACVSVLVWLQLRANRRRGDEADEEDYIPPNRYARRRPAEPPAENLYDYSEEISRVATEYSKPIQPEQRSRRSQARASEQRFYDEEDDVQTVYKARKPSEPKTRRND